MPSSVLFVPESAPSGKTEKNVFDATKFKKILNTTQDAMFACWNLKIPLKESPIEYSVPRHTQNRHSDQVGKVFGKDTRERVPAEDFGPNGKYRAICKLFLHFEGQEAGAWDEGTGWLINPTTIATCGHNVYDWEFSWGHLQSVKVYIGYNGQENINDPHVEVRHGSRVTLPAGYLEAKNANTKDVAFIRLEQPFNEYQELKYGPTTETGLKQQLTVVGYPGDLNHGEFMYAASEEVTWDLRLSGGLLQYRIPTYRGQSGSPVIRTDLKAEATAIGVHILGGSSYNSASVIGPLGNRFDQLTKALNTITTNLTSRAPGFSTFRGDTVSVPGFAFVTIPAAGDEPEDSVGPITNGNGHLEPSTSPDSRLRLRSEPREFTKYPDVLKNDPFLGDLIGDPEKFVPPTDQDFVKTVYFVNMPPGGVSAGDKATLKAIQQNVLDFQCWFSHRASLSVDAAIKAGKYKADDSVGQGSYRAMVMEQLLQTKTNWLAMGTDESTDNRIQVSKAEFHTELLTAALSGLSCPSSIFKSLENLVSSIGNGILSVGSEESQTAQQFWVMLTYYNYFPETGNFQVLVRTIGFKSTDETKKYMAGKSSYSKVDFRCKFASTQWEWNDKRYSSISASVDKKAIAEGMKLVNDDSVVTVELPADGDK